MYGFILRAAPQALFVALLGAITAKVVGLLAEVMTDGPGTQSDLLINGLLAVSDHYILVGIAALVVTWVGRAVLEARVGRGY